MSNRPPSEAVAHEWIREEKVTMLRVFVASPGDVSEERERLHKAIEELNHSIAEHKRFVLQAVDWKTDAWPAIGQDAQDVINQQIGPYDIFVGIMWKRFGTQTHRAGSGTKEEFERAYSLWSTYKRPHIMFYFNTAPVSLSSPDDAEEMAKVLAFKKEIANKGALYWEYNGPDDFERFVRQHLMKEIDKWQEDHHLRPVSPPLVRLPLQFYQTLFNELDIYITQCEQLQRDYNRELEGERLLFASDFSELHNYMYPYSPDSQRSRLNQYVINNLEDPFTLMPGAVGELLTDLDRALPSSDVLEDDPLTTYEDVARFINEFPAVREDEERIIELYGRAEAQLKGAWGELFKIVTQGPSHTAFHAVKSLIDRDRLSPIEGVQRITQPLPPEVRQRAEWVRSKLNLLRPGKTRNNGVDTIDFVVTWLLNRQEVGKRRKYISIYTQSQAFINACTARRELCWEDDYLVRGAQYLKFRTRLQELLPSTKQRQEFVMGWASICKRLQKEITGLIDLEREMPELKMPSLKLLDLYRQFDEECRMPLSFTGEIWEREKPSVQERAEKLFVLLKENGEFRGRTGEAFGVLKTYLRDLQNRLRLFTPEHVQSPDANTYMENLVKWLNSEDLQK